MNNCPVCQKEILAPSLTYCSRSCSNRARGPRSIETKNKIRAAVVAKPTGFAVTRLGGAHLKGVKRAKRINSSCPTCGKIFETLASDTRVFCSPDCVRLGGVREGSGRAKTGYYNGVYCGSTYELAFLIWNLDRNIPIQRCQQSFDYVYDGKIKKYWPDFEIKGQIYEIKGRIQDVDYVKIAACNAIMVSRDRVQECIQYVCEKYKVTKDCLWLLYDGPILKSCTECGNHFQPKTKKGIYCSQVCSMKGNRKPRVAKKSS